MGRLRRRRKPMIVGSNGDSFERGGGVVGGSGQFINLSIPFTSVADPRGLADPNGLGREFGVPTFLWVAGDGNAPTIGPALTNNGVPTVGVSPWQLADASDVASEAYSGFARRFYNAGTVDPGAGDDTVIVVIGKMSNYGGAARYFTSTLGGDGYIIFKAAVAGTLSFYVDTSGGATSIPTPAGSIPSNSLFVVVCIHNRTLDIGRIWTPNGVVSAATNAGTITGGGIGVAGSVTGGSPITAGGEIQTVAYFHAPGIAADWEADTYAMAEDFANRFTGLHPIQGDTPAFARNSAASWEDSNGIWHIASPGLPRAGDEDGLRAAPVRTNKCYNTINPQATAGWAITGGTHTVPSDAAQLLTDGAQNWGPNVHQFVPGIGDQVIYGGALSANANAHSISVFMRGAAGGESVDIGVRDVSAGTVTNLGTVVLTTAWVRYIVNGFTPGDVDEQFCLDCDLGDTVLFIAPQMELGATAQTPAPNYSTVAAAVRAAEVVTTEQALADAQGSIEFSITPRNWNAGEENYGSFINRTGGGGGNTCYQVADRWGSFDGTTIVREAVGSAADGVQQTLRARWGSAFSIDIDGDRQTAAYDGTIQGTGALTVQPTGDGGEVDIKDLKVYRNGDG